MKTIKILMGLFLLNRLPLPALGMTIYNGDSRIEMYQADTDTIKLAASVISLWKSNDVHCLGAVCNLITTPLWQKFDLCLDERFANQPSGAFCTGVLVGQDLALTSGHCIASQASCNNTVFVFGFNIPNPDIQAPDTIMSSEVYECKELIPRRTPVPGNAQELPDYALIRLNKTVTGHIPLKINRKDNLKRGQQLIIAGHPSGLALKIADNATVKTAGRGSPYLYADLDAFRGNSGSPVFIPGSFLVQGLLTGGADDYIKQPGETCSRATVFSGTTVGAEKVLKLKAIQNVIPQLEDESGYFNNFDPGI